MNRSRPAWRRRALIGVLGLVLALDLGRSLYARWAYAEPVEPPAVTAGEAFAWPPGSDLPLDAELGERVYRERCAVCHGVDGDGNGPAARSMIPRPRDFTLGQYKYSSTPPGEPPSDGDLISVVSRGLAASAMPNFDDLLTPAEIGAVVARIKRFSARFDGVEAESMVVPPRPRPDAASLAQGKELYRQGCDDCHGVDGRSRYTPVQWKLEYGVRNRDLTAPWTFGGGGEARQIWLRLATGMLPGPMPSYAEIWTAEERWDVVNYVESLARTPAWESDGKLDGPGLQPDPLKRGEYLVHAVMCGLCHTRVGSDLVYEGEEAYLAGGMAVQVYPHGTFIAPNLTSDPETGLGDWNEAEIAVAIRTGRSRDRRLNLWAMPWQFLHGFEPEDAIAIATYLKERPPVRNRVPPPVHYGFVETVIAKLAHSSSLPPIAEPSRLVYTAGNHGTSEPGRRPRDWPQRLLIWSQSLLLAVGAVLILRGGAERRNGGGGRRLGRRLLVLLTAAVAAGGAWVLYSTPVLPGLPPARVHEAAVAGVPPADPGRSVGELDAPVERSSPPSQLIERGRYLYIVSSCAFCHGADGSGGRKISVRRIGTLWVSNLTSDPETGLGAWSDRQISRAIRAGISRDGRPLHWQGMIWDHLSNLDEEDVRALIAYLRTLPPIPRPLPAPRPPAADDCAEYTFFLEPTLRPGCR